MFYIYTQQSNEQRQNVSLRLAASEEQLKLHFDAMAS